MKPFGALRRADPGIAVLLVGAMLACGGGLPAVGLHYEGSEGYVGRYMAAELENDDDVCPLPWLATPGGIEGDLPPGLSFDSTDGTLEGTPEESGTWKVNVILEDVRCAGRGMGTLTLPVSITIHEAP